MNNKDKKINTKVILKILKYFLIIFLIIMVSQLIIWHSFDVESYRNPFIVISSLLLITLFIILLWIVNQKAKKEEMNTLRLKYWVRCILITFSILMLLITFIGLLALWGATLYHHRYGFIAFIPSVLFLGFALIMWIDTLQRKLIVTEEGLIISRWNLLFPDLSYNFKDINKIKIRKWFVNVKCKSRFHEPDYMLISKPQRFIKAIKKYSPYKLDTE